MRAGNNVVVCELGEIWPYLESKTNSSSTLSDKTSFGSSVLIYIMKKIPQVSYSSKILLVCGLVHLGNRFPGLDENLISTHWLFHICLRIFLTCTPSNIFTEPGYRLFSFLFGGRNIPKFHA